MSTPRISPLADLAHWLPPPRLQASLKRSPEDFRVDEVLGFEPAGAGGHGLFWIEKTGMTTPQMIGKLSRLAKVHERDIGYCGLKDKQAVTRQWVSLPIGSDDPVWLDDLPEEMRVLRWARHPKKLRRGIHQGNHFMITLRQVTGDDPAFEQRLEKMRHRGFANYFAEQRFGTDAGNLDLLARLAAVPASQSDRVRRSDRNWGISTLRALIFNAVLSRRISRNTVETALVGDLAQLAGSHSRFLVTEAECARTQERLAERDIWLTGPLWGAEATPSQGVVQTLESEIAVRVLADFSCEDAPDSWPQHLTAWRVDQDRRPLLAPVRDLSVARTQEPSGENTLTIRFTLNSGSYATAVLRDLVSLDTE